MRGACVGRGDTGIERPARRGFLILQEKPGLRRRGARMSLLGASDAAGAPGTTGGVERIEL